MTEEEDGGCRSEQKLPAGQGGAVSWTVPVAEGTSCRERGAGGGEQAGSTATPGAGGRTGKAPLPGGQGAWPASHQMQQLAQGLSQLLRLSLSPCCCSQVSGTHDFEQTTPVWPDTHHTHATVPMTWTGRDVRHTQRSTSTGPHSRLTSSHLQTHTSSSALQIPVLESSCR